MKGDKVDYVVPSCFNVAYEKLTKPFTVEEPTLKHCCAVFIDGASGCGKTRLGWELYQRLKNNAPMGAVQYVTIADSFWLDHFAFSGKESDKDADAKVAANVLATLLLRQATIGKDEKSPKLHDVTTLLPLKTVVQAMLPPLATNPEQRRALVLHLDEFHKDALHVPAILRAVRNFNRDETLPQIAILPVMTGLISNPTTEKMVDFGISDMDFFKARLHYFGANELDKTWQLVKNSMRAFESDMFDKVKLEDAPRLLRYLVEDTYGWQVAAAYLGATVVKYMEDLLEPDVGLGVWPRIERVYEKRVGELYSADKFTNVLKLNGGRKLLLLALSPHKVRGWEREGKNGELYSTSPSSLSGRLSNALACRWNYRNPLMAEHCETHCNMA
jgi:hypothetical protein